MTRAAVVILTLCAGALQAQQQPLVGVWQITYTGGMRIEDGVATPIMATGTLTIDAKADSLVANLATDPAPDLPARPPVRVATKAGAGDATFTAHTTATININGSEREATVVSTWVLRAKGDSLEGTVQRKIEGFEGGSQEPQPVTGTRRRG
jgi:hypothetical protein